MYKQKGFTLLELIISATIALIFMTVFVETLVNNLGATEARALEAASRFVQMNGIETKRITCAGDPDRDGYGDCTIVTPKDERILLSCPVGFVDTKLFGASACKEVFSDLLLIGGIR